MNLIRTTLPLVVAALTATLTVSCASSCDTGNASGDLLRGVPIPAERAAGIVDGETPLHEGQTLRRQSYTIYGDGEFVLDRSIDTTVGSLEARFRPVDPRAAERAGVEAFQGVLVRSVQRGGAAETAGLRPDDVVVSCDTKAVTSPEQLTHYVETQSPGTEISLEYVRQGERTAATVTLGEETRLDTVREWRRKLVVIDEQARLGLSLAELTPDVRALVVGDDGPGTEGESPALMVIDILPGGPAFEADVRVRDIVTTVDGEPTSTSDQWHAAVEESASGDQLALGVWRERQGVEASATVADDATKTTGFDAINIIRYQRRPSRTEFSLLWELLFYSESCRAVEELDGRPFHRRSTRWGAVLGLVHWYSSPEMSELRLAWLLPIRVRND